MEATEELTLGSKVRARSHLPPGLPRLFMGLVAVMDQYLSTIKSTMTSYMVAEYGITASHFSGTKHSTSLPRFVFLAERCQRPDRSAPFDPCIGPYDTIARYCVSH